MSTVLPVGPPAPPLRVAVARAVGRLRRPLRLAAGAPAGAPGAAAGDAEPGVAVAEVHAAGRAAQQALPVEAGRDHPVVGLERPRRRVDDDGPRVRPRE